MAQLWGGRFTKQTDQLVFDFNASITFDKRLFYEDVTGSIVHATMLAKQGILTEEERKSIVEGLTGILEDVDDGTLAIDESQEDVHSFVEATLIDRIGDAGKKLHTGRSRNDQVALDMRLYTRTRVAETDGLLKKLLEVILDTMENNLDTYMPGFTHLQKAQPITLAHHYGAYFEMFKRDRQRLADIYKRMNYCPLGETDKCYPTCTQKCLSDNSYFLKDRLNMKFTIIPDNIQTVTTIFNSKITSIYPNEFNIDFARIDILDENIDEINNIITTVRNNQRFEGNNYTNGNLNKEL